MAVKITGTTVINDSRNIENITTINSTNWGDLVTKVNNIEDNATADQTAAEVTFDNTASGLTATNVKAAIDEVEGRVDTAETKLAGIETGATADQNASEVHSPGETWGFPHCQ